MLIIYGNEIINKGDLESKGSSGGSTASSGESKSVGGGASGGGSINIFYKTSYSDSGTIDVTGGAGGTAAGTGIAGGKGGRGSLAIGRIKDYKYIPIIIPAGYAISSFNSETDYIVSKILSDGTLDSKDRYRWVGADSTTSSSYANKEIASSVEKYGGYFVDSRYTDSNSRIGSADTYLNIYNGNDYTDLALCRRTGIWTATDLSYFRDDVNNGDTFEGITISLLDNIDLSTVCSSSTTSWTPIGHYETSTDYITFSGIFEGNNKTISNMYINSTDAIGKALFGTNHGTVRNITITGNITGSRHVAGIVGNNFGTIQYCINKCSITSLGASSVSQAGGIAGTNGAGGKIYRCKNEGSINSDYQQAGGIAGYNSNGSEVKECYNIGNITSSATQGNNIGGIVGLNGSSSTVKGSILNCYNTGNVTGKMYIGGIAGRNNEGSTIKYSYNIGSISGTTYRGSICGLTSSKTYLTYCYYLSGSAPYGMGGDGSNAGSNSDTNAKKLESTALQDQSSFINWDFTTPIWKIVSGTNNETI